MRRLSRGIGLGITLVLAAASSAAVGITPGDLRCEYHANPVAVDAKQPRLSWILAGEPGRRGEAQTAYQVLVAGSLEALGQDRGDLWDSRQVASDQSTQIVYGGKPLGSRLPCYWKVRVWDQDGKASAWSEPARWTMGLLQRDDWKGQWIGGPVGKGPTDMPHLLPAIYLRKTFRLKGPIKRATVYATAAGLYELHINGRRVGRDYFTPGWTEYLKRLYYQAYDVTGLPGEGDNVLGAILGDGWYGLHHGGCGRLAILAQLHVQYEDGSEELVVTDPTWKATSDGPIRTSDIYQGETYDARKELPGWSSPGYGDGAWSAAVVDPVDWFRSHARADVTAKLRQAVRGGVLDIKVSNEPFGDPIPGFVKVLRVDYRRAGKLEHREAAEHAMLKIGAAGGQLLIEKADYGADVGAPRVDRAVRQVHPGYPVRETQELKTVRLAEVKPGVWLFDLGQNFTGWERLKVRGPAGATVVLRTGEVLNEDGTLYTGNLQGARSTDTYILRGEGEEVWEPRFTYHGFRYVEVTGLPGAPTADAITGVVLHSDAPRSSAFECSNAMLNRLYQNIVWSQRSNYLDVPTDCPQRSERMGWAGDAQVFVGTAAYNMDVAAFFTAWLRTYEDAQSADGCFSDFAPCGGGTAPGWADAGVICPWTIYRVYGDRRILAEHYSAMVRFIDYMERNSKDCLRPPGIWGDWLNVDAPMPGDVIATAYFAYSTSLMVRTAEVLDKKEDAARFRKLLERIKAAFNRAYVAADGKIKGHTQTTYLMALGFDLLPADKRPLAARHLLKLIEDRRCRLSTGFLGVNLLLPGLTSIGRTDLAYRLLENDAYPSWGYEIKHGATTLWECWDGWTAERGFHDPRMTSFNHYAYGSCGQWMFSTMAGIDSETPGFQRLVIHPRPGGRITFVKASYDSIHGRVATHWQDEGGRFTLAVTIPVNTTATVYVPARDAASVTESGKAAGEAPGVKFLRFAEGAAVYRIGSGRYTFAAIQGAGQ